jgi:hypothetical protein
VTLGTRGYARRSLRSLGLTPGYSPPSLRDLEGWPLSEPSPSSTAGWYTGWGARADVAWRLMRIALNEPASEVAQRRQRIAWGEWSGVVGSPRASHQPFAPCGEPQGAVRHALSRAALSRAAISRAAVSRAAISRAAISRPPGTNGRQTLNPFERPDPARRCETLARVARTRRVVVPLAPVHLVAAALAVQTTKQGP